MATQYSVKMRTTCSTCAGDGLVYSALWETCLAEIGDAATLDEILEWFDDRDALVHRALSPEEETCPDCEGRGYTISECSLEDAPPVAALAARLDALETDQAEFLTEAFALSDRINALEKEVFKRVDALETAAAGNDRTFREVISDNAELAARLGELDDLMVHLRRDHHEGALPRLDR